MSGRRTMNRAEGAASELASNLVGAIEIGVNHSQQADRFPLLFELFVDAGMVSSEDAHAHHRNGNRVLRWQENSRWQVPETNCKRKSGKEHLDRSTKLLIAAKGSGPRVA